MTRVLSKLASASSQGKLSKFAMASSSACILYWGYLTFVAKPRTKLNKGTNHREVLFLDKKANENDKFKKKKIDFNETLRYIRILLKSIMSFKEVALCCGVTLGLILRTLLDLWNIEISTRIESAVITLDINQLKYTLSSFLITVPVLAFINNIIKYLTDKLSLNLRYNLSKTLYEKYMTNLTFYHLAQSNEFENVDQLLTADVDKFSTSIVELYNNISKPILDIILLVHRMSSTYTGVQTPTIMVGWLAIVGTILTQARRPLTGYIIRETQSEGQLRFVHSRLIQNSEEIAFFKGNNKEKHTLMSALDNLRDSLEDSILFKFKMGMLDNVVGRYSSTVIGYIALSLTFFSARFSEKTNEERLTDYYVSGRMMMNLAESIRRLIMAGQGLTKLAAYTERVKSLINSMDNLYSNETINNKFKTIKNNKQYHNQIENLDDDVDIVVDDGDGDDDDDMFEGPIVEICDKENPMIDFKNVTLSTPNGDILVKNLTFTIKPKQSVIISGPNGSGKSSLFRVLGDLWRVESGRLIKPPTDQLFYICQKPYMTLGSLRSQLIFPDTQSRLSDRELIDILNIVELRYLLDRGEHTLDSINDWQDVLSGGEKQRMALARLIYHRPQFAILDECTSAVAIDVEQRIYKYLSEDMNCTLLSVSHRVKQLAKFHQLILEFDGAGNFEFKRLNYFI